jgi:hypothetical protein
MNAGGGRFSDEGGLEKMGSTRADFADEFFDRIL